MQWGKNLKSQKNPTQPTKTPYPRLGTNQSTPFPKTTQHSPSVGNNDNGYLKLYVMIVSSDGTKTYLTAGC